jgi:hypothetical protein
MAAPLTPFFLEVIWMSSKSKTTVLAARAGQANTIVTTTINLREIIANIQCLRAKIAVNFTRTLCSRRGNSAIRVPALLDDASGELRIAFGTLFSGYL